MCVGGGGTGMEKAHVTDDLIVVDQNIPDWLIKILFFGEVETAIRSVIKSSFLSRALAQVMPFLACGFLFN